MEQEELFPRDIAAMEEDENSHLSDDEMEENRWIEEMDWLVSQAIENHRDGSNDLSAIRRLVDSRDVNRVSEAGLTALHHACSSGKVDIVRYLVEECHADTTSETAHTEETPFFWAVASGHLAVAKYMLQSESLRQKKHFFLHHRNYLGQFPLLFACRYSGPSSLYLVQLLVHEGRSLRKPISLLCVDDAYRTPLHYACGDPYFEYGHDDEWSHIPTDTPGQGSLEVVQWLIHELQQRHPVDFDEKDPAFDIDACTDENGVTPLAVACANGNLSIVQYLVEHVGASIAVMDKSPMCNLLHYICIGESGSMDRASAVLEYILDMHEKKENKDSFLPEQNQSDDEKCSIGSRRRQLLETPDRHGNTPLILAVMHQQFDLAEYILTKYSVSTNTRNNKGLTAWDLANELVEYEDGIAQNHRPATSLFARRQTALQQRWDLVQYLVAQKLLVVPK